MTINEARIIGLRKLNVSRELFDMCMRTARALPEMRAQDVPPITLALAMMGAAQVRDIDEIEGELTDALSLVAKAEREYQMEMKVGRTEH